MALYVKDGEVDKTGAVQRALLSELECEGGASSLVVRGIAFIRELNARAPVERDLRVGRTFIDGLYEDD